MALMSLSNGDIFNNFCYNCLGYDILQRVNKEEVSLLQKIRELLQWSSYIRKDKDQSEIVCFANFTAYVKVLESRMN